MVVVKNEGFIAGIASEGVSYLVSPNEFHRGCFNTEVTSMHFTGETQSKKEGVVLGMFLGAKYILTFGVWKPRVSFREGICDEFPQINGCFWFP